MVGTIAFVPQSLGSRTASVPITHIYIGALAPGPATASGRDKKPTSPPALTNRWVVHFTQDDTRSIRCDPSPSDVGAAPITIILSESNDGVPRDLVKTFDLAVRPGFSLAELLEVLVRGRYRPYLFHESGHGCRFWIWALLGFLMENGIVTSTSEFHRARVCLQQVWLEEGDLAAEDQQTHLVPGDFVDQV